MSLPTSRGSADDSAKRSGRRDIPVKYCVALIALTLALVGCARQAESSAAAASSTATTSAAGATPAAGATTPSAAPADLSAAATTQESGNAGAGDSGQASLEKVAALPPEGQLPAGKWLPGTNYTVLSPAQPSDAPPGKVEVVEMFWYGCPHCYAFDPYLENWKKHKASYIDFVRVPVMWADIHRSHARLFYTLQALGKLDQLHSKVFDEIHQKGDELYVSGDEKATLDDEIKFAEANGISKTDFLNAYNSFDVQTNLAKADDLGRRYRIDAVPTIVIDGKYESNVGMAGSEDKLIDLINDLAASEKHGTG
jgi:protein dithiol oxidoreductase (disulfide-forming)